MRVKKEGIIIIATFVLMTFLFLFSVQTPFVSAGLNITALGSGPGAVSSTSTLAFSERGGLVFINVSYATVDDITDPTNLTILYNITGSWVSIANISSAVNLTNTSTAVWGFFNLSGTGENASTISINVTLYNASGASVSIIEVKNLSNIITFDHTPPRVSTANITHIDTGVNYSNARNATIIINVTISDDISTVTGVFANITNSSGAQNATITLSNPAGSAWNGSFISSHFPDGIYNITIWANDSVGAVGNINNSALVHTIHFDNTAPTVTFSCSPLTVDEGDKITCICSGTDAETAVSSTPSFTPNPTTSSTGSGKTTSCTITDLVSNSRTSSVTYTVEGISSGSFGGSGGSGTTTSIAPATTITITESQLSSGYSAKFSKDAQIMVDFTASSESTASTHSLKVTSITTSKVTIVVESDPITLDLSVGETKKIDIDHDDTYDLSVRLNAIISGQADLTITEIEEIIPTEEEGPVSPAIEEPRLQPAGGISTTTWVIIIVIGIIVIIAIILIRRNKKTSNLSTIKKK